MSGRSSLLALLGEIRTSRTVLERIRAFYDKRFDWNPGPVGVDNSQQPEDAARRAALETADGAIVLAEVLGNYYTCVETIFLRISQHFENSLSHSEWHKDLLRKMRIDVPKIRPAVITEETFRNLDELLRFRHFRRYYLEFEYDWPRLRLVESAYQTVRDRLDGELDHYEAFLEALADEATADPRSEE
jgi:hypothetical protein